MSGAGTKKGSSDTVKAKKAKPSSDIRGQKVATSRPKSTGGTTSTSSNIGKAVNNPMTDMSPEFKRLVVDELIRTGKARVVSRRGRQTMAREQQKKK